MITLRYFAKYREWAGTAAEQISPVPANLAGLLSLLREKHPNTLKILEDPRCIIAVNQQVVQGDDVVLQAGDEVAFYPPVTGG